MASDSGSINKYIDILQNYYISSASLNSNVIASELTVKYIANCSIIRYLDEEPYDRVLSVKLNTEFLEHGEGDTCIPFNSSIKIEIEKISTINSVKILNTYEYNNNIKSTTYWMKSYNQMINPMFNSDNRYTPISLNSNFTVDELTDNTYNILMLKNVKSDLIIVFD